MSDSVSFFLQESGTKRKAAKPEETDSEKRSRSSPSSAISSSGASAEPSLNFITSADWQSIIQQNVPPGTPLSELDEKTLHDLQRQVLSTSQAIDMSKGGVPSEDIFKSFLQSVESSSGFAPDTTMELLMSTTPTPTAGGLRSGLMSSGMFDTSLQMPSTSATNTGSLLTGVMFPPSSSSSSDAPVFSPLGVSSTSTSSSSSSSSSSPSPRTTRSRSRDAAAPSSSTSTSLHGSVTSSSSSSSAGVPPMAGVPGVGSVADDTGEVGLDGRTVAGEIFRWPYHSYQSKKLQEQSDHFKRNLKVKLKEIREKQKRLVVHPRLDEKSASALEKAQTDTIQALRTMMTETERLITDYILLPEDVQNLLTLQREVNIEIQQLELYIRELAYYRSGCPSDGFGCFATLVVTKQPFPKAIKKNTKVTSAAEEPTLVRMLTGAKADVRAISKVRAELIYEDYHEKEGTFTTDEQDLNEQNFASFYNLKFSKSTRLKVARLQFAVEAQYSNATRAPATAAIQSESSAPFIVLTNESQWESSEGILLKKDAFKGNEITWMRFANYLQVHYLRATRQDPLHAERPLSLADLNFIAKEKFNDRPIITKQDFDVFWLWFGKVLRKVRHQQPFGTLWLKGLVYGFLTRAEAEYVLKGQPVGTFLIRFSLRVSGKIVITSVVHGVDGGPSKCQHFLVSPDKTERPTRLMELIENSDAYQQSILLRPHFIPENGHIRGKAHKNRVFAEFYGKKSSTGNLTQYYQCV